MNYRHAFHAGNFADVLKHAVLALVIEHLKLKPAAFRVIDTHAGIGRYDLASDEAARTGEFQLGIGRLVAAEASLSPDDRDALRPYLSAVQSFNVGRAPLSIYPGSPCLSLALMRDQDRLVANELHPIDVETLRVNLAGDRRAKVLNVDGWHALKALLPPKERRGVVLVDPPFEEPGELERLTSGLAEAVRRFATGTFLLWFPIKSPRITETLVAALASGNYQKLLLAELYVRAPTDPERVERDRAHRAQSAIYTRRTA